jgi:hypothetical protein
LNFVAFSTDYIEFAYNSHVSFLLYLFSATASSMLANCKDADARKNKVGKIEAAERENK